MGSFLSFLLVHGCVLTHPLLLSSEQNDTIERLGAERASIYRRCKIEDLELPLEDGSLENVPLEVLDVCHSSFSLLPDCATDPRLVYFSHRPRTLKPWTWTRTRTVHSNRSSLATTGSWSTSPIWRMRTRRCVRATVLNDGLGKSD